MRDVFEVGDRIELTHLASAHLRKVSDRKYSSQLLDFDHIRTAKISAPVVAGRTVACDVGDDYNLCFFTKSGLYQCSARIKRRYKDNQVLVLEVVFNTLPKKFQRRKYYRLECMFQIKFRRLSKEEIALNEKLSSDNLSKEQIKECNDAIEALPKKWIDATVSDLSGGGVRFHTTEDLDAGEEIRTVIPLSLQSGIVPMKFPARVVTSGRERAGTSLYEVRAEFLEIKDREREMVVRYVFEEQRRRMRKGD